MNLCVEMRPARALGTLSKRGHFRKNWKTRHFELKDGCLTYAKRQGAAPKGRVPMAGACTEAAPDVDCRPWCIEVRFAASGSSRSLRPVGAGPTQSLVVSCNSDANRAAWLGALRRETARCVAMEGEFTLQSDKEAPWVRCLVSLRQGSLFWVPAATDASQRAPVELELPLEDTVVVTSSDAPCAFHILNPRGKSALHIKAQDEFQRTRWVAVLRRLGAPDSDPRWTLARRRSSLPSVDVLGDGSDSPRLGAAVPRRSSYSGGGGSAGGVGPGGVSAAIAAANGAGAGGGGGVSPLTSAPASAAPHGKPDPRRSLSPVNHSHSPVPPTSSPVGGSGQRRLQQQDGPSDPPAIAPASGAAALAFARSPSPHPQAGPATPASQGSPADAASTPSTAPCSGGRGAVGAASVSPAPVDNVASDSECADSGSDSDEGGASDEGGEPPAPTASAARARRVRDAQDGGDDSRDRAVLTSLAHDYVFERLMARTELFQGLATLKRQAAQFVGKVVDAFLASQERQTLVMHPDRAPFALRTTLRSPLFASRWRTLKSLAVSGALPASAGAVAGSGTSVGVAAAGRSRLSPEGMVGDSPASTVQQPGYGVLQRSPPSTGISPASAGAGCGVGGGDPSSPDATSAGTHTPTPSTAPSLSPHTGLMLDDMVSMAGLNSPAKKKSKRYGAEAHPGHLRILHYPPEMMDEALSFVPVLEPRYIAQPNLPRLNKWQHRKCAECHLEQTTGMFGQKAVFCNYTELLFCALCIGEENRQIPWRIIHLLDKQPKRVWSLAAEYIDGLWDKPMVDMRAMAPKVYAANPAFEALTTLRRRLLDTIEVCKTRRGAADTLRALRGVLGDQLLYLSESVELLAVGNVIAASTGDLESVVASAIAVLMPTGGSE